MWDAQGTVDSVAVLRWRRGWVGLVDGVVTMFTEIVGAPAAVKSDGAAVHALPVDLIIAVFAAFCRSRTDLFQEAILAEKIFLFSLTLLGRGHLLLAVD